MTRLSNFNLPLDSAPLRAFVSYATADKEVAGRVKSIIESMGHVAFTAHDDIAVSAQWREWILEELKRSDLFVAILSTHFRESAWAPQEAGIACFRGLFVIPISLDETVAFGFMSTIQSERCSPRYEHLYDLLTSPIVSRFPRQSIPRLIHKVKGAHNFREAEGWMKLLMPVLSQLTQQEAQALAAACTRKRPSMGRDALSN